MKCIFTSSAIFFFLALIISLSSSAQTTFVKTGGTGNGSSWAEAAGDLRAVLATAQNGQEIWVAAGTYKPTTCSACSSNDRQLSFLIPSGVKLYGGFSGSETALSQRNIAANTTILSGDINADNQSQNNSYHVVTFDHVTSSTRLDGFKIVDGNANGNGNFRNGAAIFNDGSIGGQSSIPLITNCSLENNLASGNGAGIYNNALSGNCSPVITNCNFLNNHALEGGAMFNQGFGGIANPVVRNCVFTNNSSNSGGAVYNAGYNGTSNPRFEACLFKGNTCTGYGGAIYNFAKDPTGHSDPVFADCIFDGNTGTGAAGAIYALGSSGGKAEPRVIGCVFYDNYSNVGGAVYTNASDNGAVHLHIDNSIFTGSRANFDRILHFSGNSQPQISISHTQFDATSCSTITGSAGGILNCGAGLIFNSNAQFVNASGGDFHLLAGAPGVDAGLSSVYTSQGILTDFENAPRIQGAAGDLGAYEFATGDSDGDGILDSLDNCPFIANPSQVDADADGFGAVCDCNDNNPAINPNATEVCDGVDNNCNLQIDESGGTTIYYADTDNDSFGDPLVFTTACSPPAGYVLDNTDCDDSDSATYPGAPELCDGKDNNCNLQVDEGAIDVTPPSISCKPLTITAAAGVTTNITPADVYLSGSDNCGPVSLVSVVPNSFVLPGAYNVTLTAEDNAGNQETCTAVVTIIQQTNTNGYCSVTASQPWTEWVANVAFSNIDNASGKCGSTCGYSDYTALAANVSTGEDVQLVLTPGLSWAGYQPDLYWRVWIDWNQDGDFADAGETVATANSTFLPVTRTVTIPTGAALGSTRMRVAVRRDVAPTACTNYIYGEVEDYTVNVAAGGPRLVLSGCPSPIQLSVLPGDTSAIASWTTPTATTSCSGGLVTLTQTAGLASGSSFPLGTSTITYTATDDCNNTEVCSFTVAVNAQPAVLTISCPANQSIQLSAGQTTGTASWSAPSASSTCPGGASVSQTAGPLSGESFAIGVTTITYTATDACGGVQACSFTVTVLPAQTNPGTYCTSETSQPWVEWIASVKLSNVDNSSGKCDTRCGYGNFTNLVAALTAGTPSSITLTPGLSWPGYQPDLHWRVWIDWNADGDFDDAGELVVEENPGNQEVTVAITPPATASGVTRMRVSMQRDAYSLPCETFIYGEVEDYGILVSGGTQPRHGIRAEVPSSSLPLSLKLAPNPARDFIKLITDAEPTAVNVFTLTGQQLISINGPANELDINTLAPGIYLVAVSFETGDVVTERLVVQ